MAKICAATGAGTTTGKSRSHSSQGYLNATSKRTFKVNLQKKHVIINGKHQTVYLSVKALKSDKLLKKAGIQLAS